MFWMNGGPFHRGVLERREDLADLNCPHCRAAAGRARPGGGAPGGGRAAAQPLLFD